MVKTQPITFYPHWLTIPGDSGTSIFNESTGQWEPVAATPGKTVKCRAKSNTTNGFITSESGERIDYSWIIYMPLDAPIIPKGTSVIIKDKGIVLATDTVKQYFKQQMNTRIWL